MAPNEKRVNLSNYCNAILSGVSQEPGRPGGRGKKKSVFSPGGDSDAPPRTITAVALLLTAHAPTHHEALAKYGPSCFKDINDAAAALKEDPLYQLAHAQYDHWVQMMVEKIEMGQDASASELCPESWANGRVQLHFHTMLFKKNTALLTVAAELEYGGKHVDIRRTVVDRRSAMTQVSRGAYYVTMPKNGQVTHWGRWIHGENYSIQPSWITTYVARGKMTFASAKLQYLMAVDRARFYIEGLDWIENKQREMALEKEIIREEIAIQANLQQIYMPREWQIFKQQFQNQNLTRFNFFVATGPPKSRKTQSIKACFKPGTLLVLNCSGDNMFPDFRQFIRGQHEAILCDEGCPELVIQYKDAFQATNTKSTMGTSPTNMHAYQACFYRVQWIICSNKWHDDMDALWWAKGPKDYEWLAENAIVADITPTTFSHGQQTE